MRRFVVALLSVIAGTTSAARATSAQTQLPVISAPSAIVLDGWTGNVLYARNPMAPHYPASTVKIMTALLVLRRHIPLQRVVTVSPYAASFAGSTAGLFAGERITVWNLLHGMLLPSGNDAAVALSEVAGGTEAHFVDMMNREAARLHLWHTHYLSPNGFDAWGEVTTAHDLALLARAAMRRPTFVNIVHTKVWNAWTADGRYEHHWTNLNRLLWWSPHVDGVKTGTTPGAGACLVASARWHGKWIVSVNLGSTQASRFVDGMHLLDYGLAVDAAPPSTLR